MNCVEAISFLSRPFTSVSGRDCDMIRSDCPRGKKVTFMANGILYSVEGEDLWEAVGKAIELYGNIK